MPRKFTQSPAALAGMRSACPDPDAGVPASLDPPTLPLGPGDLAALGRDLGRAFKEDPANARRVAKLKLADANGLRQYDPHYRLGAGFRVYCGLHGVPDEPCYPAAFPYEHLPVEVVDFWSDLICGWGGVDGAAEAMMVANNPAFSNAFVAAVVR